MKQTKPLFTEKICYRHDSYEGYGQFGNIFGPHLRGDEGKRLVFKKLSKSGRSFPVRRGQHLSQRLIGSR